MQKTRFALIGCGKVALRHLEIISNLGELIAVCDINETVAKEIAALYRTACFTSFESFIEAKLPIDIVVICTPNGLHARHAIYFLKHGFHVLVEKPMSLSTVDAAEMITTARKQNRYLFTVLQNRFNPYVRAVYESIQKGELGKIFSVQVNCFWNRNRSYYIKHNWHGNAELDGGVLFTQFSHFIDLLYWYLGPVKDIHAFAHNVNHLYTELPADEGVVAFRFENGVIGSLQFSINAYQQNMEGSITLIAERGTVKIGGPYLNSIVYQDSENGIEAIAGVKTPLEQVYQSMLRTLEFGEAYYAPAEESMAVIQLIEGIHTIMQMQ